MHSKCSCGCVLCVLVRMPCMRACVRVCYYVYVCLFGNFRLFFFVCVCLFPFLSLLEYACFFVCQCVCTRQHMRIHSPMSVSVYVHLCVSQHISTLIHSLARLSIQKSMNTSWLKPTNHRIYSNCFAFILNPCLCFLLLQVCVVWWPAPVVMTGNDRDFTAVTASKASTRACHCVSLHGKGAIANSLKCLFLEVRGCRLVVPCNVCYGNIALWQCWINVSIVNVVGVVIIIRFIVIIILLLSPVLLSLLLSSSLL